MLRVKPAHVGFGIWESIHAAVDHRDHSSVFNYSPITTRPSFYHHSCWMCAPPAHQPSLEDPNSAWMSRALSTKGDRVWDMLTSLLLCQPSPRPALLQHKACPWNANYQVFLAKVNWQSEFCIRSQLYASFLLEFLVPCQGPRAGFAASLKKSPSTRMFLKPKPKSKALVTIKPHRIAKSTWRPLSNTAFFRSP